MLKSVILFIVIVGATFYLYMGFHTKIEIKETTLSPKIILFKEYLGDYRDLNSAMRTLEEELHSLETKNYQQFGMYYDDPNHLENSHQARAIIGVLLDIKERHIAGKFLVDHANYRINENNEVTCLSSTFPYRNELSMSWIISKVYPAIVEYGKTKGLFVQGNTIGALEIYHYKNNERTVEVLFPYGTGIEKLLLNRAPKPTYVQKNSDL